MLFPLLSTWDIDETQELHLVQRDKMITAVCQITSCAIGCLLYSSSNVDLKTNREIFEIYIYIWNIYIYLKSNASELNSKYRITFWHAPGVISVYKTLSCKLNWTRHSQWSINQKKIHEEPNLFYIRNQRTSHHMCSMSILAVLTHAICWIYAYALV